ncbi:hypothetical protein D9758_002994 [Tetrapyrgos nigripes]|uniref:Uncharacterized protein n=1 Tax=Tetrapyrgos nigripes TaxID=182062 RepID=A0A8H5GQ15_9AGAR|nr:hypothetical protein D9758_002994 [Tetrapyrgos nigripes]
MQEPNRPSPYVVYAHHYVPQYLQQLPNPHPLQAPVCQWPHAPPYPPIPMPARTPNSLWKEASKSLNKDQKILEIAHLIRETLQMTPTDFTLSTISSNDDFSDFRNKFYVSHAIESFLNVVESDKRGQEKLKEWMKYRAVKQVAELVSEEMEGLKGYMKMGMEEITSEFLEGFRISDITKKFEEASPTLRCILKAACQTERAARENTIKTPELSQLCRFRSENSQCVAIVFGGFLYSTGVSKKVYNFLSTCCQLVPSHRSMRTANEKLASDRILSAQRQARLGFAQSHDNTQLLTSVHIEQRDFMPKKVQVGTTSLILSLRNAPYSALSLSRIISRRANAPLITFNSDIRLSPFQVLDFNILSPAIDSS